MGEGRTDKPRRTNRLTVQQAAAHLGISEGAVRNRIKRGTLRVEREAGRVYVLLAGAANRGESNDEPQLVAVLREQLAAERQAHAEARRIIAGLVERIPAIEAPQEAPEDAETVEEATDEAEPHSATEEPRDELGDERARREMAESTLQEGMTEERRRREEAERERDDLRQELYVLRRPPKAPDAVQEEPERAEPHSATGGAQESVQRPWWRKLIGR